MHQVCKVIPSFIILEDVCIAVKVCIFMTLILTFLTWSIISCVLQPEMLLDEAWLGHDLLALRHRAIALQDQGITSPAPDFADIILLVEGKLFR